MKKIIRLIGIITICCIILPLNYLLAGSLIPCSKCLSDKGEIETDISQFIDPYTGGSLILPFKDIDIPVGSDDLSLSLIRTYNSRSRHLGFFGYGWHSNYELFFHYSKDGYIEVSSAEGKTLEFFKISSNIYKTKVRDIMILIIGEDGNRMIIDQNNIEFYFNNSGRLEKIRDRNDNEIIIQYSDEKISVIKDLMDREMRFYYKGNLIEKVIGPMGRTCRYVYDDSYNLIKYIDSGGRTFEYKYDNKHNMTNIIYPDGNKSKLVYSGEKKLENYIKGIQLPDNSTQGHTYKFIFRMDKTSGLQSTIGAIDRTPEEVKITDARGNVTEIKVRNEEKYVETIDAFGNKSIVKKNKNLYVIERIDKNENGIKYDLDERGNMTKMIDSLGNEWKY